MTDNQPNLAILFADWICRHNLDFQTTSDGYWIGLNMQIYSSDDLYKIFKQEFRATISFSDDSPVI